MDVLEELDDPQIPIVQACAALGVSRQTLHQIMTRARSVTPEMALRLESVVGSTAEMWLTLQAEYDLSVRRKTLDTSKLRRVKAA